MTCPSLRVDAQGTCETVEANARDKIAPIETKIEKPHTMKKALECRSQRQTSRGEDVRCWKS